MSLRDCPESEQRVVLTAQSIYRALVSEPRLEATGSITDDGVFVLVARGEAARSLVESFEADAPSRA